MNMTEAEYFWWVAITFGVLILLVGTSVVLGKWWLRRSPGGGFSGPPRFIFKQKPRSWAARLKGWLKR